MEKKSKQLVATQANELIESRYSLTVQEQRLILAMISKISPKDKDFKPYSFSTHDLAFYLNMDVRNVYAEAPKVTERLISRVIQVRIEGKGLLQITWVSSAKYIDGVLKLRFDPELKPYLLDLKERFTKVSLPIIAGFQSAYSVRIYMLLKQYEKIGYREFELSEFRNILGLGESQYKDYRRLNSRIIGQAKKEFKKKRPCGSFNSDISFDLEVKRTGRSISHLKFIIKKQQYQGELPLLDNSELPVIIQKLVYFGLAETKAKGYLKSKGEQVLNDALDVYAKRLQSGQVKKTSGAYLIKLIEEEAKASDFEKEQTAKAEETRAEMNWPFEEKKQFEDNKEAKKKEQGKSNRAVFDALHEKTKAIMLEEYGKFIPSAINKKAFLEHGLSHPLGSVHFNEYLVKALPRHVKR